MYATGEGVETDDDRAFAIFAGIVNDHAADRRPNLDNPFVAAAFVALGKYYRAGTVGGVDAESALQLFWHAATYFNSTDAQLNLAQMFYRGETGAIDPGQAVRWANLAAQAGDPPAQALLGYLLFQGEGLARQPLVGLAYLNVALARGGANDPEIRRMHEEAFAAATETERRTALELANDWLRANATPTAAPPPR
jgi:TPR repeat protein